MTNDDRALRYLAEANPVPNPRKSEPGSLEPMDLVMTEGGADMQTEERTLRSAPAPRRSRPRWAVVIAATVLIMAAGAAGWLIRGVDGSESTAGADIEEQISALIDGWYAALTNEDAQAAGDLLTEDARIVGPGSGIDGRSGEELMAWIEFGSDGAVRTSEPLIYERYGSYHAVVTVKGGSEASTIEHFELFTIVEEDGVLKIRFAEVWAPVGWFRPADDQPYQQRSEL